MENTANNHVPISPKKKFSAVGALFIYFFLAKQSFHSSIAVFLLIIEGNLIEGKQLKEY